MYAIPPRLEVTPEPQIAGMSCPDCCGVLAVQTEGEGRTSCSSAASVTRSRSKSSSYRDPVLSGAVYVAPRDQHMIFEDGVVRLSRGAREHHTRPAIDPLFRSAADRYGSRVVGVVLSGMGSDGVSGLIAIKKSSGISLVQHPGEAQFGSMPCAAIAEDDVDAMLTVDELAIALAALARGEVVDAPRPVGTP